MHETVSRLPDAGRRQTKSAAVRYTAACLSLSLLTNFFRYALIGGSNEAKSRPDFSSRTENAFALSRHFSPFLRLKVVYRLAEIGKALFILGNNVALNAACVEIERDCVQKIAAF